MYYSFTFILFFIYFIVISLFGFLIQFIFNRAYLNKKVNLKRILKSFAIGLSIHLIYGTIIISLRIFNFFTIYLPFILCDIGLLIYILYRKSNSIKKYFKTLNKHKVFLFFKEKSSIIFIFIIVFSLLYILQMYFIDNTLGYVGNDAYYWFQNIWFVHKYGFLDYNSILSYPPGYLMFCSTIISPINDYTFSYFFLKYLPFFLSIINLLVLFVISNEIFKEKIYIFFTLVIYLGFTYLFYRSFKPVPSVLATSLGFLFLLFLGKGTSNEINLKISSIKVFLKSNIKNKYVLSKGLLLTGITLIQPLYGMFYMVFYFSYECFLFLIRYNSKYISFNPRLLLLRNYIFSQLLIILVCVLLLSPFVIGTSLNRGSFILKSYLSYATNRKSLELSIISNLGDIFKNIGEWFIFESVYRFFDKFIYFIFDRTHIIGFYKETILVGFFIIFSGLFLNFKKSHKLNEKQNNSVNFIKYSLIFSLITFFLCQFFVYFFNIPFFSTPIEIFYEKYKLRFYEIFSGYWALIFVLAFNYIVIKIKKKYLKLKKYKIPSKRISRFFKISLYSSIIFTSSFFYIINFEKIKFPKYINDDQAEANLYIGDHFEKNPLKENTTILLENLGGNKSVNNRVYGLIVDKNLNKKYYNFTNNLNYSHFYDDFNSLNSKFVFLNISKVNENFKSNFSLEFNTINEWNSGFIFLKVK